MWFTGAVQSVKKSSTMWWMAVGRGRGQSAGRNLTSCSVGERQVPSEPRCWASPAGPHSVVPACDLLLTSLTQARLSCYTSALAVVSSCNSHLRMFGRLARGGRTKLNLSLVVSEGRTKTNHLNLMFSKANTD